VIEIANAGVREYISAQQEGRLVQPGLSSLLLLAQPVGFPTNFE